MATAPLQPSNTAPVQPLAQQAPLRSVPATPQGIVQSASDEPSAETNKGGGKTRVIIISLVLVALIIAAVLLLGVVKKPFAGLAVGVGEGFDVAPGEATLAGLRDSEGSSVESLLRNMEYDVDVYAGVDALDSFIFAVTLPGGVSAEPMENAFTTNGFDIRENFIDGKYYVYGVASSPVSLDGGLLGTLHLRSGMD